VSQETGRIAEAAALAPAVAPGIREAATVAASLRDAPASLSEPSQPDREASTQAQPEPQRHEPTRTQPTQATEPGVIAASDHTRAQRAVSDPATTPTQFSERAASTQPDGPQASAQHAVPERSTTAPVLTPPLDPPALKDFRHPEHPLNARYQMFRDALGEQGFHEARPTLNEAPEVRGYSAEQKDRLAAGFTAQVGSDMQFNTEIQHFRKDGDALLVIEHPQRLGDAPLVLVIPEKEALARSPDHHAAGWRQRELPEPQAVDTQRATPKSLSPDHPGHPDHPCNALFEHTRDALSSEYGRWGIQKGAEQLDRETVQVMTAAREGKMDDVGAVRLMPNRDEGKIGGFPKMQVFESAQAAGQSPSTVFVEGQTLQQAPPVRQAAQQFQQVDQQATQQILQNQQLQAQIDAQAPQAPGMGR
jgi:hypothetical protein